MKDHNTIVICGGSMELATTAEKILQTFYFMRQNWAPKDYYLGW